MSEYNFVVMYGAGRAKPAGLSFLLTTARANKLARNFLAINRQLLELESCSNPLRIQQVF